MPAGRRLRSRADHGAGSGGASNSSSAASAVSAPSDIANGPAVSRSSSNSPRSGTPYSSRSAASSSVPLDEKILRIQFPIPTFRILSVKSLVQVNHDGLGLESSNEPGESCSSSLPAYSRGPSSSGRLGSSSTPLFARPISGCRLPRQHEVRAMRMCGQGGSRLDRGPRQRS
jgi:hypothetical protein